MAMVLGRRWNGKQEIPRATEDALEANGQRYRPARVLIMGHSFVHRLETFLIHQLGYYNNLNIGYNICELFWHGLGGANVPKIRYQEMRVLLDIKPDVVILELGTNDACNPNLSSGDIASGLINTINDILGLGAVQVVICPIIYRASRGIPYGVPQFNGKAVVINQLVSTRLANPVITPGARAWHHFGLWRPTQNIYPRDGTHLNAYGQYRLFRSIRGAVLQACRRARSYLHI